jgi:hypothetical protein
MHSEFVENLDFENVSYAEYRFFKFIKFESNQNMFELSLHKGKYDWIPIGIFHGNENHKCCFCEKKLPGIGCQYLYDYMGEILEILKEHPNVRMHLLFGGD